MFCLISHRFYRFVVKLMHFFSVLSWREIRFTFFTVVEYQYCKDQVVDYEYFVKLPE